MYCLETVEGTVANKRGKEVPELVQEKVAAAFCSLSWVTQKVNTSQSVHSPLGILMNFVVTSIIIISSCILNVPGVSSGRIFFFFPLFFQIPFQEQGNEKTNNGTHYKLQLLYSNGESLPWPLLGAGISRIFQNSLAWIPFSAGMGPGARMGLGNRTQQKPSMGLLCCSLGWMPVFLLFLVFSVIYVIFVIYPCSPSLQVSGQSRIST